MNRMDIRGIDIDHSIYNHMNFIGCYSIMKLKLFVIWSTTICANFWIV